MSNKATIPILALLASALAFPAAANKIDAYLGAGYGQYKFEFDEGELEGLDDEFDDNQDTIRVHLGFQVNDIVGLEAAWYDFDDSTDGLLQTELEGGSLGAVFAAPFHERFQVFAKVGWFWWDAEVDNRRGPGELVTADQDGDDAFFGVGANIGLTESLDLRFDYDRFEVEDDFEPDLDLASVSLQVRF